MFFIQSRLTAKMNRNAAPEPIARLAAIEIHVSSTELPFVSDAGAVGGGGIGLVPEMASWGSCGRVSMITIYQHGLCDKEHKF